MTCTRFVLGLVRSGPLLVTAALILGGPAAIYASPVDRIGEKIEDVTLRTMEGKSVQLLSYHTEDLLVVAYTGVGCPIAQRYGSVLEKLSSRYAKKGVRFVGINANPQDDAAAITKEAKDLGIEFPILKDQDQALTRQLDAKTTTVAFVVDKDRIIRYRGMIDDQYALGEQRSRPKNHYLKLAIKAVLDGEQPKTSRTAAPGCRITLSSTASAKTETITYASHIAGIVQDNCQQCHRAGQIGPFPLSSYEQVRGWSAMIYSVLDNGRMPPWNAHPDYDGVFINQRALAPRDKKMFMDWITGGMPRGNPDQDPPEKEWPKGWRIGEPDEVLSMRTSYSVPKKGPIDYRYFTVNTSFKEDMWVKAVEAVPGAPEVVHHILVYVVPSDDKDFDPRSIGLGGYLAATVPGDTPSIFPKGAAKRVPAGAKLVFQVHYTPNGKRQKDKCSVGMVFAKEPAEREVITESIYDLSFSIPAGEPNYEVTASHTLDKDIMLLSLFPHMHYRGDRKSVV